MVCSITFDACVNNVFLYVYLIKNMSEKGYMKLSKHKTNNCLTGTGNDSDHILQFYLVSIYFVLSKPSIKNVNFSNW